MIASAATSREEIGNPVHPGTKRKLKAHGIACDGKYARQLTKEDGKQYDYLIGMDTWNIRNILRIIGNDPDKKVHRLLEYADKERDIDDPWYTGDFDATYRDVSAGCKGLLEHIRKTDMV